jgi:hypothetical protein
MKVTYREEYAKGADNDKEEYTIIEIVCWDWFAEQILFERGP